MAENPFEKSVHGKTGIKSIAELRREIEKLLIEAMRNEDIKHEYIIHDVHNLLNSFEAGLRKRLEFLESAEYQKEHGIIRARSEELRAILGDDDG